MLRANTNARITLSTEYILHCHEEPCYSTTASWFPFPKALFVASPILVSLFKSIILSLGISLRSLCKIASFCASMSQCYKVLWEWLPWWVNVGSIGSHHARVDSNVPQCDLSFPFLFYPSMIYSWSSTPLIAPLTMKFAKIGKLIVSFIVYLQEGSKLQPSRIPVKFLTQLFNQLYFYLICCCVLDFRTFCVMRILCRENRVIDAILDNWTYIIHQILFLEITDT